MDAAVAPDRLRTCPTCGLAQILPDVPPRMRARCHRCATQLVSQRRMLRSNSRTAAVATAALILYPLAMTLPMIRIERLGYAQESSILTGIGTLFGRGNWFIGIIVLLCSVVFPLAKLLGLLTLASGGFNLAHHHKAWTYRLVEWTGRWGMLDVLLVAILVAAIKLGDLVDVTAGPAAVAFTLTVLLSLAASACFDPHALWRASERNELS